MDPESSAEPALGIRLPPVTGWFNLYFADERWEWSPEVAEIHGYRPGTVTPTTDLVMRHTHPDDHQKMAAALDFVRRTHQAISTRHRIIDAQGRIRDVIVLAEQLCDDTGAEIGLHGFYVDVTPGQQDGRPRSREYQRQVSDAVAEIAVSRGPIEQVKGMLMLAYRIDERQAFNLLKWRSHETKVKLRALAVQLVADLAELDHDDTLPSRSSIDRLLLTAHLRIGSSVEIAS